MTALNTMGYLISPTRYCRSCRVWFLSGTINNRVRCPYCGATCRWAFQPVDRVLKEMNHLEERAALERAIELRGG